MKRALMRRKAPTAFDDKAELQELEAKSRKLTFTIAFRKGQWLAEMGRKRAFTEIWRMAGLGQKWTLANVRYKGPLTGHKRTYPHGGSTRRLQNTAVNP